MLYAVLDTEEGILKFARAGQCPVVVTEDAGGGREFLTPRGMALGLERGDIFDSVLEELTMSLHTGEVVVFYTDGFTEAMDDRKEEFGEERLAESISMHRQLSAQELIQSVLSDVHSFTGTTPQHDDMTMIVIKTLGGTRA
jgi:sigma-B regulation protein RsbU (phosphoserine phosphatase)